jgi:membrane-associated phospholipid phosphatase
VSAADSTRALLHRLHRIDVALAQRIALPEQPTGFRARVQALATHALAHMGDSWFWLIVFAAGLRTIRRRPVGERRPRLRLLLGWAATIVATTAAIAGIKRTVRRARPREAVLLYGRGPDSYSFPSGHAARMAAIASWATALIGAWGVLVWPFAALVAWSRVRLGIHYVGDVVAGAAVGGLIAALVKRLVRRNSAAEPRAALL